MFRGINRLNLDAKGRVAVPTRYRERLQKLCGAHLIVTIDTDRCLLIYPIDEWQDHVEPKLMALPSLNKTARQLQRLILGHATEVDMDAQGRLLLPQMLREYAFLEKQAVLIGQGNKFELWDEVRWNEQRESWLEEVNLEGLDLSSANLEDLSF